MKPEDIVTHLGSSGAWLLLATSLGVIVALAAGVSWVNGRALPGALATAAVGLPGGVGLVLAHLALSAVADEGAEAGVARSVVLRLVLPLLVGAPASLLLLFAAVAGAMRGSKRFPFAAAAFAVGTATCGLVVASGLVLDDALFANVRAFAYGGAAVLVSVALLAGAGDVAAREAAAAAGATFPILVAAGEGTVRAMAELQALVGLGSVPAEHRARVVDEFVGQVVAAQAPWSWAVVGTASLIAVLAIASAFNRRTVALHVATVAWVAVGAAMLAAPGPTEAELEAAASATEDAPSSSREIEQQ